MSAVLHIKARWADSVMVAPAPAAKIVQTGDRWELILKIADNGAALSVYLSPGATAQRGDQGVWVLEKLGEGVYTLNPSVLSNTIAIQVPGHGMVPFHAYVVLYGCPNDLGGYPETDRPPGR